MNPQPPRYKLGTLTIELSPYIWCPQEESNFYRRLRRSLFYPLNYGDRALYLRSCTALYYPLGVGINGVRRIYSNNLRLSFTFVSSFLVDRYLSETHADPTYIQIVIMFKWCEVRGSNPYNWCHKPVSYHWTNLTIWQGL